MTKNKIMATCAATLAAVSIVSSPVIASQSSKNTWRNIGIGSAAVGILGATHHNGAMTAIGIAGAAYSAHRYEQDRHNQSKAHQRWLAHERWERDHRGH